MAEKKPGRPPAEVRRDAVLSVRLTDAEYARVQARAMAARKELSDYARARLISVYINSGTRPFMAD
jgi:mobilization protein NikA